MDTIKIAPLTQPERERLEEMDKYRNKQRAGWSRSAKIYYKKHYSIGGGLDDVTVAENIVKRRKYYKDYHRKKNPKPPTPPEELLTIQEIRIAHRNMKRKEYNKTAYLKRIQQE